MPAVRRLFELLDEDGGGSIDVREMAHALRYNEEAIRLAKEFESVKAFVELSEGRKKKKKAISAARKSKIRARRSMRQAASAFGGDGRGSGKKKKGWKRSGTRRGNALGLEAVVEEMPAGRRKRTKGKKRRTKGKKRSLQLVAAVHRVTQAGKVIAGLDKKTGKVVLVARRSSAEHLSTTKALRCTATAWMLIVAESFAKF